MTVLNIIIGLIICAALTYIVTKMNKVLGAIITILASLGALVVFLIEGDGIGAWDGLGILEFTVTPLGWFFAITMLVVYSMVSFFNPYWMKKMMYPETYNLLYLLSLAGTIGVFFADNFIVLFIFWEIVVWASMFIVPFGKSRKASVVYYAMSTFGSFTMLYAIFMLYAKYDSFKIETVLGKVAEDPVLAVVAFILILLAGMVKLGVFPFHIWLPLAHGNAPDTFSPILSGGLVKLGAFAAIMVSTILPANEAFEGQVTIFGVPILLYILLVISAISIIIGTLHAIAQNDAKKLLAYSSVANAGYILIGIMLADNISMSAALMHIFAHAIASAAAFLAIGAVSYRTGTTKMSDLGGMIHRMPITYLVYLIAIISMAGIPPMAGFISKWMLFQSLAEKGLFIIAATAFFGSVGSFLYVFRPLAAVFLGQLKPEHKELKEAPVFMVIPMIILSLISLVFGVVPNIMVGYIQKINVSLGIISESETIVDGLIIKGTNGNLDPTLITTIFGIGFVIALIIFLLGPKTKKVGLMDTYTAGEFIHSEHLYHYSYRFYAPVVRLYENYPKVTALYIGLVKRVEELGNFVKYWVFSVVPSRGVLLLTLTLILVLWGETL